MSKKRKFSSYTERHQMRLAAQQLYDSSSDSEDYQTDEESIPAFTLPSSGNS